MDNRYYNYDCPPLMNDGRFLSSYIRSNVFDQYVRTVNSINTSQEYKHFLQNNGDQIINNLKSHLKQNNTCKINGKCLPMSKPNNFKIDNNQNPFLDQISNELIQPELLTTNLFQSSINSSTDENLSVQKANELARNMYLKNINPSQNLYNNIVD